jgi:hypothetical protein
MAFYSALRSEFAKFNAEVLGISVAGRNQRAGPLRH